MPPAAPMTATLTLLEEEVEKERTAGWASLENILSGSEPGLERTGVAETTCVSKWLKVTADQLLHPPARNMNMQNTINVNWKFSFD